MDKEDITMILSGLESAIFAYFSILLLGIAPLLGILGLIISYVKMVLPFLPDDEDIDYFDLVEPSIAFVILLTFILWIGNL